MSRRSPPKLATALLKRLGPSNDALAGDLREEYSQGKSAWWYWRQVLAEIAVGVWRESYQRIGLAVGTVLAGVTLVSTADAITSSVRGWLLYRVIQPAAWSHPIIAAHGLIIFWIGDVAPFAIAGGVGGWMIGRLKGERRGLVILFSLVVFIGLFSRWSIAALRAIFVSPRHMPMAYLLMFIAGQIAEPSMLALVSGLIATESSANTD
jgi:hypothetical protein